jgi:soluble lytic murein transglycosylase-like protein
VAHDGSWRTLAEMDVRFGRSRRRAALRRVHRPRPRPNVPQAWRVAGVALVLFALLAESGGIDISARASRAAKPAHPACPIPAPFRSAFTTAAARTHVPLPLLVAVAYQESRMDPAAESRVGAQGLLQLMPATARELRLDAADPNTNVLAGATYLRRMLDRFPTADLALAAYNAGPSAVERAGGAPTSETAAYVADVTARWRLLRGCR